VTENHYEMVNGSEKISKRARVRVRVTLSCPVISRPHLAPLYCSKQVFLRKMLSTRYGPVAIRFLWF